MTLYTIHLRSGEVREIETGGDARWVVNVLDWGVKVTRKVGPRHAPTSAEAYFIPWHRIDEVYYEN